MINERNFVKVSRNWKDREIQHSVCFDIDGVSITTPLDQFLSALAKEIVKQTTPDTLLHKAKTYINKGAGFGLDSRMIESLLQSCYGAVVQDMKEQTKHQ